MAFIGTNVYTVTREQVSQYVTTSDERLVYLMRDKDRSWLDHSWLCRSVGCYKGEAPSVYFDVLQVVEKNRSYSIVPGRGRADFIMGREELLDTLDMSCDLDTETKDLVLLDARSYLRIMQNTYPDNIARARTRMYLNAVYAKLSFTDLPALELYLLPHLYKYMRWYVDAGDVYRKVTDGDITSYVYIKKVREKCAPMRAALLELIKSM